MTALLCDPCDIYVDVLKPQNKDHHRTTTLRHGFEARGHRYHGRIVFNYRSLVRKFISKPHIYSNTLVLSGHVVSRQQFVVKTVVWCVQKKQKTVPLTIIYYVAHVLHRVSLIRTGLAIGVVRISYMTLKWPIIVLRCKHKLKMNCLCIIIIKK